MQSIDLAILIILGAFFLIGLVRGFILQIGAIVGFFISLWIAGHYYGHIAKLVRPSLGQWPLFADQLAVVVGYIAVFWIAQFLIGLLIKLLNFFLRKMSVVPFLNLTNRLGGAGIGLIEGILFLSAVLFLVTSMPLSDDWSRQIKKSFFVPLIRQASGIVKPFLPDVGHLQQQLFQSVQDDFKKKIIQEGEARLLKQ